MMSTSCLIFAEWHCLPCVWTLSIHYKYILCDKQTNALRRCIFTLDWTYIGYTCQVTGSNIRVVNVIAPFCSHTHTHVGKRPLHIVFKKRRESTTGTNGLSNVSQCYSYLHFIEKIIYSEKSIYSENSFFQVKNQNGGSLLISLNLVARC